MELGDWLGPGLVLIYAGDRQGCAFGLRNDADGVSRVETEVGRGAGLQRQLQVAAGLIGRDARAVQPELDLLRLQLPGRPRAVDAKVDALGVGSVENALDDPGRPVQCAKARADDEVARLPPRRVAARLGADALRRHLALWRRRALDDRLVEPRRRALPHQLVDVAQMQAELVVPDRVHSRVVLAAEPPEPVAAFGDQDLPPAECCRVRKLRALPRLLLEPRSGVGEKLPSDVVLRVANPGVEAGAGPAARAP